MFPIRGRLALREADAALRESDLRRALFVCRAYLATRIPAGKTPLRGADAVVAVVAAFCAMCFGDEGEVKGAAALLQGGHDETTKAAATCVRWFLAALRGDIDEVLASRPQAPSPLSPELAPFVLVVAAEKGYERLTPARIAAIRPEIQADVGPSDLRTRAAVARAVLSLMAGERAEATQALAEMGEGAAPMFKMLAAMAREDIDAALEYANSLSPEDRGAATSYAALLTAGASSKVLRGALDAFGPHATAATRAALVASLAVALSREGDVAAARALLDVEMPRSPASATLAAAAAVVALSSGDAARAKEVLRSAPRTDAAVVALLWAALALGGEDAELARELGQPAPEIPQRNAAILGPYVLAALARGGVAPRGDLPAWMRPTSEDATGLFAFGLVRLWQGHEKEAMEALDRATSQDSGLTALGDAPEVARLGVAKRRIEQGDVKEEHAFAMKSARLGPIAARLGAFAFLRRAAAARKIELDASRLSKFVEALSREHASGTKEGAHLAVLREDLACFRVRSLMREGKMDEARAARKDLPEEGGSDVAFLCAALDAGDERIPLSRVEEALRRAAERDPGHAGLSVLLAEIGIAVHGKEAGISVLESARARGPSALLDQALATAYRGAHRGLEAKRVGFAELRRSGVASKPELLAEMAGILSLEAPPASPSRVAAKVTRKTREGLLPQDGLSGRAHVLFARASAAIEREPSLRADVEAAVQKLKLGLMSGDLAGASAAEIEIVKMAERSWP